MRFRGFFRSCRSNDGRPSAWLSRGRAVDLFERDVLRLPLGTLFRQGEEWAVFVAAEGRSGAANSRLFVG